MAQVVISNLTSNPLRVEDLYATIPGHSSVTTDRAPVELSSMRHLQTLISQGLASITITPTADELGSSLLYGFGWKPSVANMAALPSTGNLIADVRYSVADNALFSWSGSAWVSIGGGGGGGGVATFSATAPLTNTGTATNVVANANYNVANGIAKLDGGALVPAAQSRVQSVAGKTGIVTLDHTTDLANIGTNSHAQIDTFIASKAQALGLATLDGSSNLVQAVPFSTVNTALAAANASINVNAHKITNLATPTAGTDASTKAYVDALIQGLEVKAPVRLASAAALPANVYNNGASGVGATLTASGFGALSVDGIAVAVNDRVLVKNEGTTANNGIYIVSATGGAAALYVLTRTTDMNLASEFPGAYVLALQGTANINRGFTLIADPDVAFIIGTTGQTWLQFTGVGDLTAGNGITFTGNTISVSTTLPDNYTFSAAGTAATFTNNVSIGGILTTGSITAAGGTALPITGLNSSTWQVTGGTLTVQTTSQNLTVQTVTSGTLALTSAGAANISASAASTWQVTSANLTVQTVTSGTLALTSAGALNLTGAAASTHAYTGGAYILQTTSQNLTVQTVTSGTLAVTSAGALNLTGVAASTHAYSGGAYILQTTSQNLTVQTVTSGTLALTSAGAVNISAAAACSWTTSSSTVTIDAATGINIGTTNSTGLTISRAGQSSTVQGSFRAAQDFRLTGIVSPTAITGTQNNYAPAASQSSIIRQALSGAATITGLSISQNVGFITHIVNIDTTNSITINSEDAGSTAANRFTLAASTLVLAPGAAQAFFYDNTSSRWRPLT